MKNEDETNGYLVLIKAFINADGKEDIDIYPDDKPGLRVYSNEITDGRSEFQRGPDKVKFEFIDLTDETDRKCIIKFDDSWTNIIKGAPLDFTLKKNKSCYINLLKPNSNADDRILSYEIEVDGFARHNVPPKMIIKTG